MDYTYDDDVLTVLSSKEITIENTDKDTPTDNTITVAKDVSANIILAGVNIDVANTGVVGKYSGSAAFCIPSYSQGDVTVTLKDGTENTLKSGVSRAGLEKSGTGDSIGTLTIKGSGTLNTYGGNDGTGIGAAYDSSKSCANIIIESGTIFANGSAAGIGGAKNGSGNKITIKAGNITAKSSWAVQESAAATRVPARISQYPAARLSQTAVRTAQASAAAATEPAAISPYQAAK